MPEQLNRDSGAVEKAPLSLPYRFNLLKFT
jgi:hypothetical protein